MFRRQFWLAWLVAACLVIALGAAACGGGDDDDEEEEEPELDVAALVVAAFEEEPRLPDEFELTDIQFNSSFDSDSVATVDFLIKGSGIGEAYAIAVIYRDDRTARTVLQEEVEGWDATESEKARGRYCFWDEFSYFTNADFKGISYCLGRAGNVYLELELGEVIEEDPEAGIELLVALERHFDDLIEDATRRPRNVPPLPKAAMLASVPVPGPEGTTNASFREFSKTDEIATDGLVGKVSWAGDAATTEFAFLFVFESPEDADDYRSGSFPATAKRDQTSCVKPAGDPTHRVCSHQVDEVVIITQRQPAAVVPDVDTRLQKWVEALAKHVADVSEGKLPGPPKGATPGTGPAGVTRTPTAPPATPTATRTPLPPLSFINAGTWTLDLDVEKNTCASGLPAAGSVIQVKYEFEDSDGDGYIENGEPFYVQEILPVSRDIGIFTAALPHATWIAEARNGSLVGRYTIELGFDAADSVFVEYTETYAGCEIHAH